MKKRRKYVRRVHLLLSTAIVAVLLFVVIIVSLGSREFNFIHQLGLEMTGAAQSLSTGVIAYFSGLLTDYRELVNVREENQRLRAELVRRQAATSQYLEAAATNVHLRKLLDLKESLPDLTISARVIGRDHSPWFKTLTIDRGSDDGVERGMPAITGEGIVGQVINTSPNYARIMLAQDPNSAIDVIIQRNRIQGIIRGDGHEFVMHYVLRNSDVEKGDRLITSGMDGVFPKGVPVGWISEIAGSPRGMFKSIRVTPATDFSRLEYLIIIVKRSPLIG